MAHHITNRMIIKDAIASLHGFSLYERVVLPIIAAQRGTLFLWVPVFFALGGALYFSLDFEPYIVIGLGASAISLSTFALFYKFLKYQNYFWLGRVCLLALFLVSFGFFVAQIRTAMVHAPPLERKSGAVDIVGTIDRIETLAQGKAARVLLSELEIERVEHPPAKVRIKISKGYEALEVGQRIEVLGALNPPSPPVVPGGFDFARHMYFKGIGALGFAYREPEILSPAPARKWISDVDALRHHIAARVYEALPGRSGAIAVALLVGERQAIEAGDRDAMRAAGLAHLLAISGLHVGLVCGILFFFVRLALALLPRLALYYPIKKYAAVVALFGGVIYMLLAGASVPTQRAILMSGVVLFAVMFDRMALSMRLVAFAALVVLLIAPESLLSASFQLSFAAVVGLIAFYDWMRPVFVGWYENAGVVKRLLLYLFGVCVTSVIASFATMPFALFHFQQVASYGVLGNLVAVPLMGFVIMPAGILSLLAMPVGLEAWPLWLMQIGIEATLDMAHWIESLPVSVLYVGAWSHAAWVCLVIAGLFVALMRGSARGLALVPLVLAVFFQSGHEQPDILVSDNMKLILSRHDDGAYIVSDRRSERFMRENWARYMGIQAQEGALQTWARGDDVLFCDEGACRGAIKGRNISFVKSHYAQQAECSWADILISREPLPRSLYCDAPYIIHRWDGWRNGVHAVYVGDDGGAIRIENARYMRGDRPWVATVSKR